MVNRTPIVDKRIQIVMIEPAEYKQIAGAFHNFDLQYDPRSEELDLPAVMQRVTWQQYVALLDALPERYLRQAYYKGTLELRDKTMRQQRTKCVIRQFIWATTAEFGIPLSSHGSATRTKESCQCGVEPDESFYVENERAVRGWWHAGPEDGPPPDLALETDLDRAYLDRLVVFAVLGVPEVWKYDGDAMRFYRLTADKRYESIERSLSFPFLTPDDINQFLMRFHATDDTTLTKAFLKHARCCFAQWKAN